METRKNTDQGTRRDPDTTNGKNDIISTSGIDGASAEDHDENQEDVFSDERLDQPGGTSGAQSGTSGLARDDD